MTPDAVSLWTAIYVSLCGLAVHGLFLWRDALFGAFGTEVLLLEMRLLTPATFGDPPAAALRLARLLRSSRENAAELSYSRLVLAKTLLAPAEHGAGLRRDLEGIADPGWRERSLAVLDEWEKVAMKRMTVSSPLLWWRALAHFAGIRAAAQPNPSLLEVTFAGFMDRRRVDA